MAAALLFPRPLVVLAGTALAVACLYWARGVLIPIALALLFTFLLNPVVGFLRRLGLNRIVAVILVVLLAVSALGAAAWAVSTQLTSLAHELPKYRGNIRDKIAELRGAGKGGALEKVQSTAKEVLGEIEKVDKRLKETPKPVPVVVMQPSVMWKLPSLLETLGSAALVVVLVVFMLVQQEEMRNRLIRLIGYGRLTITTKALDEAGQRVSRYLLTQSLVNASFGAAIGLGLFFIGLPYAVLFGFLVAVLRFIPYVGIWIAAALPAGLALAVFPGWRELLLVIGLFLVLEPLAYLVLEPLLYRKSSGISAISLLVAAVFWTWLWGPPGLVLAVPLTVCLVVFASYLPEMEMIAALIGEAPALDRDVSFYQRLLAGDQDEAMRIIDDELKAGPPERIYDDLLVPALTYAKRDRLSGHLTPADERAVVQAAAEIVQNLPALGTNGMPGEAAAPADLSILSGPARDEVDRLALIMLDQLLAPFGAHLQVLSTDMLTAEVVGLVVERRAKVVCLAALPPGGQTHSRYLCKRLRQRVPNLRIVVGRWGLTGGLEADRAVLREAGADEVGTTLAETRDQLLQALQLQRPSVDEDTAAVDGRRGRVYGGAPTPAA